MTRVSLLQTAFVFIVIQLAVAALITLLGFVFHIGVFEDLLIAVPVFVVGLIGFFACIFWETEAFFVLNTVFIVFNSLTAAEVCIIAIIRGSTFLLENSSEIAFLFFILFSLCTTLCFTNAILGCALSSHRRHHLLKNVAINNQSVIQTQPTQSVQSPNSVLGVVQSVQPIPVMQSIPVAQQVPIEQSFVSQPVY